MSEAEQIRILERALKREKAARLQAEQFVEEKTLELYERNLELTEKNKNLELLNIELKEKQGLIMQAEKMASIGQLAAGVAHEINNPLAYIKSNLQNLKEYIASYESFLKWLQQERKEGKFEDSFLEEFDRMWETEDLDFLLEDSLETVTDSLEGCIRVRDIVQGLNEYSRSRHDEMQVLSLKPCLETCLKVAKSKLSQHCEVKTHFFDERPILGNNGQLNQVFLNLIVNASQAIAKTKRADGLIEIRLQSVGDLIEVTIEDNGCGMDERTQNQIFDPFFTTKSVGEGTGLGLSVVLGILQSHKASTQIQSKPGKGTRFSLFFPAYIRKEEQEAALDLSEFCQMLHLKEQDFSRYFSNGNRLRPREVFEQMLEDLDLKPKEVSTDSVLVLEDVPSIAMTMKSALEKKGFRVVLTTNVFQTLIELNRDSFKVLVMDMGLPIISGQDLLMRCSHLLHLRSMKVLVCSAFPTDQLQSVMKLGADELLEKPVRVKALQEKVEALILS